MMLLEKICLIFNTNFHTLLARCFKGVGNVRITYYFSFTVIRIVTSFTIICYCYCLWLSWLVGLPTV